MNTEPQNCEDASQPWRVISHHSTYEDINRSLVDAVELGDGDAIVDLGCGDGLISRMLLEAHTGDRLRIWAVDPDPGMLADARLLVGDQVGTLAADAETFGEHFPPQSLDAVILANALHLLDDRTALYRNLRRVLAPGGVVAFNTTFYLTDALRPSNAVGMEIAFEARALARRRGLTVRPVSHDSSNAKYARMLPPPPGLVWELHAESFEVVVLDERQWTLDMGFFTSYMSAPYQTAAVMPDLEPDVADGLMQEAIEAVSTKRHAPVPRPWLNVVARYAPSGS